MAASMSRRNSLTRWSSRASPAQEESSISCRKPARSKLYFPPMPSMSKCGRQTKHKLGQTPTGDDADSAASVIADAWPFAPSTTALVKMEGRMMPFRMSALGQKRSFAPDQPKVCFAQKNRTDPFMGCAWRFCPVRPIEAKGLKPDHRLLRQMKSENQNCG